MITTKAGISCCAQTGLLAYVQMYTLGPRSPKTCKAYLWHHRSRGNSFSWDHLKTNIEIVLDFQAVLDFQGICIYTSRSLPAGLFWWLKRRRPASGRWRPARGCWYTIIYIQCRSVLRIVEIREPLGACLAHLPGRNGDFSPGTERDGFS